MLHGFLKNNKNKTQGIKFEDIQLENSPTHVAIIMDGNGRWAKSRALPRVAGHREGMKVIKDIVMIASKLGIKILTLYAFSTENWKRPETEVKFLMDLPQEFLLKEIDELIKNNIQIKIMGFVDNIPSHTLEAVREAEERTKNNTGLILNFALNYGGRNEILSATKSIAKDVMDGKLNIEDIDEEIYSNYLLTNQLPDPDLLIRTSGEQRISNFLLWQLAYTELWYTPVYWPEFNQAIFLEAVYDFQQRGRRFGGV